MSFLSLLRKKISFSTSTAVYIRFFSTTDFNVHHYLISSFGFPPTKAATIFKSIAHIKSPQKPDAVRHFLDRLGFSETEIKTIVTKRPSILCSDPEKTMGPNLRALQDIGLSASTLKQIIFSDPVALQLSEAVPRINFWRDFVGGEEETIVKVFKHNRGLIGHDTSGGIATKISLLQSRGISIQDIRCIICKVKCFITCSVSMIEDLLKRAKELGFRPETKMFRQALMAMTSVTREGLQKKMELFKSFGWSEKEFLSALCIAPSILPLAEDNLRAKMDFLLGEAKCDVSYIVAHPQLITYSLQNRLMPRHHVLHILEARRDFLTAICMSNNNFMAKFILPHQNEIPDLYENYITATTSG